jgi:hypothetical protein
MSVNKGTNEEEPKKAMIDEEIEKEIKEKALTNILEILKWELKEDENNFNLLPLSDFQKEELIFDYLKDNPSYEELIKKYNDVRKIYDLQKQKEKEQKKLESLVSIMEATGEELQKEEDEIEWEKRLSPND